MKSLEHLIRDIREGKAEKGTKDSLAHAIRKVHEGKRDDIDASAGKYGGFDKMNTESDLNYIGSGTGGEPKMHAEDGKKKKTDEAVGSIGTDDYQGNQFKSVRSSTPHIKPPAGPDGHSQAPENVSRQRTLAKEKGSMTLHGKVNEQTAALRVAAPVLGAGVTAGLGALAAGKTGSEALKAGIMGGKQKIQKFGSYFDKLINPPAEDLERAKKAIGTSKFGVAEPVEAPPKTRPGKKDEPIPGVIPDPSKPQPDEIGVPKPKKIPDATPGKEKVKPPKPDIGQPEKAPEKEKEKTPPVTIPAPKAPDVPAESPAKAVPAPGTPAPVELPPPYKPQKVEPKKTEPAKAPVEYPKPWKEVGPEAPATKPVELPAIDIPGTKTQPKTKPDTKVIPDINIPAAKPQTKTEPRVVQLPAIDVGTRTKTAADIKVAPATVAAPAAAVDAPATTTPKSAETPTTPKIPPLGMGMPVIGEIPGQERGVKWTTHPVVHRAKKHKSFSEQIERKQIENVPRKGDRKSIAYVGREEDNPKTAREKTSRQAAYKVNIIDENKKLAGIVLSTVKDKKQQMKSKTEDGVGQTSKDIQYPNGTVVRINPEISRTTMDIDGKLPNDYK